MSVLTSNHVIDGRRHTFAFKIASLSNGTLVGHVTHQQHRPPQDDEGALYYVVAVLVIYGLSILMIITSYIRKNKNDRKLNRYLKEMAHLRKREFQMQLYTIAASAATAKGGGQQQQQQQRQVDDPTGGPHNGRQLDYKDKCVRSLKCLSHHKTKSPRFAFSTDNNRMVLELPASSNTTAIDSDNETSTEGDYCSSPSYAHWDADSRRGSSRKGSGASFLDVDAENLSETPTAWRKKRCSRCGEDLSYLNRSFHGRRDSASSLKGTRVVLVRREAAEANEVCQGALHQATDPPGAQEEVAARAGNDLFGAVTAVPAAHPSPEHTTAGPDDKPIKSVRLLLPEPEMTKSDLEERDDGVTFI